MLLNAQELDDDIQQALAAEKEKRWFLRTVITVLIIYGIGFVALIIWISSMKNECTCGEKLGRVENGGTGLSTPPPANHVLVGNGTGYTLLGPLPVAAGGSGLSSMANKTNSMLCSGATENEPFHALMSGESGQVLTSNGPGTLPTWLNTIPTGDAVRSINGVKPVSGSGNFNMSGGSGINVSSGTNSLSLLGFGRVKIRRFYNGNNNYTPTAGMKYCIVEAVGGGGGGGAALLYGYSNSSIAAGGGGAGSYIRKIISASEIGQSIMVTIGNGGKGADPGTPEKPGPTNMLGMTGEPTSFGNLLNATAGGGGHGNGGDGNYFSQGGEGGGANDLREDTLTYRGSSGQAGLVVPGYAAMGGYGGQSYFGAITTHYKVGWQRGCINGTDSSWFGSGSGGIGGSCFAPLEGQELGAWGGAGSSGSVIVTEFIWE